MLDWIKDIEGNFVHKKAGDFSLCKMEEALKIVGNPDKSLKNVIHVAGTNGKGSVCTFIESILQKSGYKICKYTSPHIVNFNERIVFNGRQITDDELFEISEFCREKISHLELSFFEITTIIAFIFFAKSNHDAVILETGLGGRLDATNVISKKLCAIITSISLDHMGILGDTKEKIAAEKAGIIKNCDFAICAKQETGVKNAIIDVANELNNGKIEILFDRNDFFANGRGELNFNFTFAALNTKIYGISSGISGLHQINNASLAIACCLKLSEILDKISKTSIKIGIKSAFIMGRICKIKHGEIKKLIPNFSKTCDFIVDGSHNIDSILKLAGYIKRDKNLDKIGIFSLLSDKSCDEIYEVVKNIGFKTLYICEIASTNRRENLYKIAENLSSCNVVKCKNLAEIFEILGKTRFENTSFYLFGSMFFLSDFYKLIFKKYNHKY
ncbi:Bifunctional protein FolC [Candidatus Deianiraea vastatrix]|uniref:Bifunctional protein FolC n=2 Tax=Candidatus Deianiraea vastatrix TaxID=2163644 RepID=A0A5B8XFL2_9RICK|nr:Bifunctional protein FolC [Candidatus Deianiraea vastatrix]